MSAAANIADIRLALQPAADLTLVQDGLVLERRNITRGLEAQPRRLMLCQGLAPPMSADER